MTTMIDKVTTDGEKQLLTHLIELARLGAMMQDNPDRAKVLNQFAELMGSYLPKAAALAPADTKGEGL